MLSAFVTHADCLLHEMGNGHPECAGRIAAIRDHLLIKGLLDHMQVVDAPMATEAQLARVHSLAHIRDMFAKAPTEGHRQIDPDTSMNRFTLRAALRSAGAAVLATDLVLTGDAPTAFCCVRPPGHHADHAAAMGFCFFNNVAVGIGHALEVHGVERIALIDFDVHHGNGSADIFRDEPRVLMCSIFEEGLYPFGGGQEGTQNMVNVGLPSRSGGEAFRTAVRDRWLPALEAHAPQLIYVSAGFDAHREDDMGNLGWVEADYAWVTKQVMAVAQRHAFGRVVSCLEGGYALSALGRSVAAHVKVLIGAD